MYGCARFSRRLALRGLALFVLLLLPVAPAAGSPAPLPDVLSEYSASMWGASADAATASVFDDTARVQTGSASLRLETDAPFDCRMFVPATRDADWDVQASGGVSFWGWAENPNPGFQGGCPWIRIGSSENDYVDLKPNAELLNDARGQWMRFEVPLNGDAVWGRTITGAPDLAHVAFVEIHADTWDSGFTLWVDGFGFTTPASQAGAWPMKQRDSGNTGRADFAVPDERLNDRFFDIFRWQTPAPGSPGEGGIGAGQMTFFEGAGPGGADIVVGGYHWPKGVQGMDRHTGQVFWAGNPSGGESIGDIAPAFSPDGRTIYVVNDSTDSVEFPQGHPMMAFASAAGPDPYWHNGGDPNPWQLGMGSPKVAADGRIFMHNWVDRPYGGTDSGSAITTTWAAELSTDSGLADPALYDDGYGMRVIIGGRNGWMYSFSGESGNVLWYTNPGGGMIDASATIDRATGNIYVGSGSGSIWVAGLDKDGNPLWGDPAKLVFDYQAGVNNPQRAQSAGCLSSDGATYYFQTNSQQGDGRLYAINTSDGSVKWEYPTGSLGWEMLSSSPIVTPNGVIIVGNNDGATYYALKDEGGSAALIDTLSVEGGGTARASASLAPDGSLYLPVRTIWSVPGAGQQPTFQAANLFTCIDLNAGATPLLSPPGGQAVLAQDHAVLLTWQPIIDPSGVFDHYAVYRATGPFTSVDGMTPIDSVTALNQGYYQDVSAENGISYWYAVTSVAVGGNEVKSVPGIGPVTPYSETDLQVISISRTPRYPRYAADYTDYTITEPSGFGPYTFSASTGLGMGQTAGTQRWPNIGDQVTYTATVRNRGTRAWDGTLHGTWTVDGSSVSNPQQAIVLHPNGTTTFAWVLPWDGASHQIGFTMNLTDDRPANNALSIDTRAVGFLTYADLSAIEHFRENSRLDYPGAQTDDLFDWLNRHMARFNQMFAAAGSAKRVHYDVLQTLFDTDPDPGVDRIDFAIFPFRYYASGGDPRLSGYYNRADDIDYGLLHEMGHQLGLIDIYQLDVPAEANLVSGLAYTAADDLMRTCAPFLSPASALPMTHWLDKAHGYYGQYLYNLPAQMRLRLLGADGKPLAGASVKMYQYCDRPGIGKVITDQVKAEGTTDSGGVFALPNVPINPAMVPPAYTGDTLHDNPFGYVAVVGSNGVLHFKVTYEGATDYCWLDINEANVAFFQGQTDQATFDRKLALGGPVQYYPPDDLAELNAADWSAWADGSDAQHTYVQDDTGRRIVGAGSVHFTTDGGFDTYLRYPGSFTARWDLSWATKLKISFYAENSNGFQSGSPWIRLKDGNGAYVQYQWYQDGGPLDLLNDARGAWQSYEIPLDASTTENNGWRRSMFGTPNMADIHFLEIHADTWGYGFQMWVDGVSFVFGAQPAASVGDARAAGTGAPVSIPEAVVSAAFPDFFYVETAGRSSGIRVQMAGHGLSAGQLAKISGTAGTTSDGEKFIQASYAAQSGDGSVAPVTMINRTVGGGDTSGYNGVSGAGQRGVRGGTGLNNIGLLVRTFGRVTARDTSSPAWFVLDDGSGRPVRVDVPGGASVPSLGAVVAVTGPLSCYWEGADLLPRILPPDANGISVLVP